MKTIGMIGGISWESTHEYYHLLNKEVNSLLGRKHSAPILLYSFDFEEIMDHLQNEDFIGIGERLIEEAKKLEAAGADLLMLCANTAHRWAGEVVANIQIPLVHIGDATGKAIKKAGIGHVLLLGTEYTMDGEFIKGKLLKEFDIQVTIPGKKDRQELNRIIFDELIVGEFKDSSRQFILDIIGQYPEVEGVILGCTELPLIIKKEDCDLPLFNTTALHAHAAIKFALQ